MSHFYLQTYGLSYCQKIIQKRISEGLTGTLDVIETHLKNMAMICLTDATHLRRVHLINCPKTLVFL